VSFITLDWEEAHMGPMGRTVGAAVGALLMLIFFATIAARIHHTSVSAFAQTTVSRR
jgi:hypothetical protein